MILLSFSYRLVLLGAVVCGAYMLALGLVTRVPVGVLQLVLGGWAIVGIVGLLAFERTFLRSQSDRRPVHNFAKLQVEFEQVSATLGRSEAEREKAQRQLMQAQKMEAVGQLAGGLAHNFNNLIVAARGNLELLLVNSGEELSLEQVENINEAILALQRGSELIRQLMVFSRGDTVEYAPLDMRKVIIDSVDLCRRTFDKRIEIRLEVGDELKSVTGNGAELQQVLLNLMLNARDALEESRQMHPRIAIDARNFVDDGRDMVCISVIDNGTGIDDTLKARIFEPFFTTKPPGRGTGLGLATVYAIVRQHQGRVWVEDAVGGGTVFRFSLPCASIAPSGNVSESGLSPNEIRGNERILVVDDDQAVRRVIVRSLQRMGYDVESATDGRQALQAIHEGRPFDLVLLDLSMPEMSGQEFLEQFRLEDTQLPVVIYSGVVGAYETQTLKGANMVIHKALPVREVAMAIRSTLAAKG